MIQTILTSLLDISQLMWQNPHINMDFCKFSPKIYVTNLGDTMD